MSHFIAEPEEMKEGAKLQSVDRRITKDSNSHVFAQEQISSLRKELGY